MITSSANELIKHIKKLQTKKSYRYECGEYVIEGVRQVRDASEHIKQLVSSESFDVSSISDNYHEIVRVSDKLFSQLSATKSPQGIMATAAMHTASLDEIIEVENPLILFCDGISDPGNLGTIIRTGDAAGISGIILSPTCVDLYNPKTVRSTMASMFNIKIHICDNSIHTLKRIKGKKITVFGSSLSSAESVYRCDFRENCAFVVGNEAIGISDEILTICDKCVKIPILGKAESLNVSVAASLLLYEAVRQRQH